METGYIYRFYNKITGKSYIGQTIRPLNERVAEHLKLARRGSKFYFHCALSKYGIENFEITILHTVDGKDKQDLINKLNVLEVKEIEHYNSFNDGYNSTTGGENYVVSEQAKQNMSNACKGKKFSEEHKKHLSEAAKKRKPIKRSAEWCKKISESLKGKDYSRIHTPESRKKAQEKRKGYRHSEETKAKIKQSLKENRKLKEAVKNSWIKRKEEMIMRKLNEQQKQLEDNKQTGGM